MIIGASLLDLSRRPCFTVCVDRAEEAAQGALHAITIACTESGLTDALRGLVQEVYSINLARYEPDELGDTARSLGFQGHENMTERALRRFRHDDRERADTHWSIDGLHVATPRNVLTFELAGASFLTMKVPPAQRRTPDWEGGIDWRQKSNARLAFATENSEVLNHRTPATGMVPLFSFSGAPGIVRKFMFLWAGEASTGLTAGWLAVPVLGERPFLAHQRLWWDTDLDTQATPTPMADRGPNFDERPAAALSMALKRRPQEGQA